MMKKERDVRGGAVVVVGVLLLGFIGCAARVEPLRRARPALDTSAAAPASDTALAAAEGTAAMAAERGFLSDFPTEPPAPPAGVPAVAHMEETPEATLRVHEIRLTEREGRQALAVRLSRPPEDVRDFTLRAPNRVVIDVAGPVAETRSTVTHALDDARIARVRVGTYDGKLRLVADTKGALPETAVEVHDRWVLVLLDPSAEPAADSVVYLAPGVTPVAIDALATATDPQVHPIEMALPDDDPAPASAPDEPAADPAEPDPARPPLVQKDDLVPEEPAFEQPAAYAMAARATQRSAAKSRTLTTEGGTAAQPPLAEARAPREYTGQRISLDFKDADIQNVLRILADVSGLNIITTEEVQGKITMRLADVPWDQALEAILKAKGLDMVRDGNIVRVSTVEQLKKERDAQRAADEAQKQVEPLRVKYLKVNYAKADEKLIKKLEEKVLTERGSATWDERTNTVVVRDISRGVTDAEEFVRQFDTQTPQVLIEANIVEATDDLIRDLGVQWGYTYKASPETGNAPGVNFPGRVGAGGTLAGGRNSTVGNPAFPGFPVVPFIADFPAANVAPGAGTAFDFLLGSLDGSQSLNVRLTALERQGKGKIISRPRVVTLNNVPAKIESLQILRVKLPSTGTVISTGAGGVAGSAQAATEQIRTGITLQVTPQVSSDGFIFLDIFAKSSTLSASTSPDLIPDEISREAESHVLIRDGETFVLGGVFRNTLNQAERGIPYLRSIPVLGWAFKNNLNDDRREELLVFVTPSSVHGRGSEDIAKLPSAETLWQNRVNPAE